MKGSTTVEGRTAHEAEGGPAQPVTLMHSFLVPEGRDDAFLALWKETSEYFRRQPGFLSLRLHRAVNAGAEYRYVNVARWESDAAYRAPHGSEELRALVLQEGWMEFPSSPMLYEVMVAVGDDVAAS
ncbi:MAG: hypothetical protein QOJ00_1279 [Actinomycetota bacterium]